MKRVSIAMVLSVLIVCPNAFAQRKSGARRSSATRNDPWLAAQQAFARLDFGSAYRISQAIVAKVPRHFEARRLAAKSARELQKYSECLTLVSGLPPAVITNDDVNLVGECAWSSQFSAWVITFLQQNLSVVEHRDTSQYWLGKYHYKNSEYAKADGYLTPIAVLPARLEKDRQFMLSRIRDIRDSQRPLAVPPQPTPASTPNTAMTTPVKPATPQKMEQSTDGFFAIPRMSVHSFFAASQGNEIPIDESSQKDYERILISSGPTAAAESLDKQENISKNRQAAKGEVGGYLGYRTDTLESHRYLEFGAIGKIGLNLSNQSDGYFTFADEAAYPNQNLWQASRGYGFLGGLQVGGALNKYFGANLYAQFAKIFPAYKNQQIATVQNYGVDAFVSTKYLNGTAGFLYRRAADRHTQSALNMMSVFGDIELMTPFYLAFRNPRNYPLIRYSSLTPVEGIVTKDAFFFSQAGGQFFEFNLTPRVQFNSASSAFLWFRMVQEGGLSYFAPSKAETLEKLVSNEGSAELANPSARFDATRTHINVGYEWAQSRLSVMGGASFYQRTAKFKEGDLDKTGTDANLFESLLTGDLESGMSFFLDLTVSLN